MRRDVRTCVLGAVLAPLLVAAAAPPASSAPVVAPAAGSVAAETTTARTMLLHLSTRSEGGSATYERSAFRHWVDADQDGCDTREEVLIAESRVATATGAGCRVLTGRWVSWYDGATWTDPSDVDIDHVVALKEAWESGARSWTSTRRQAFANDLGHPWALEAVTDTVNAAKADRDPAQWLPPRPGAHCRYAQRWVAVKYRWRLTVDSAERAELSSLLSGSCGDKTQTISRVP